MKKFLCLVMGILIVFSSILFVACDLGSEKESESEIETGDVETGSESGSVETTDSETTEENNDGVTVVDNIAGMTAYEAFAAYLAADYTNYTLVSTTVSTSEYGESKIKSTAIATIEVDGENAHLKVVSPDTPYASSECWYLEGYLYTNYDGDKYKEEYAVEEFFEYDLSSYAPDYSDFGITEESFNGVAIEKNKDGEYRVFLDLTEALADVLEEEMGEDEGVTSYVVTLELVFNKDGSMKSTYANFEATGETDGMQVSMKNAWSAEISNIGTTTVAYPDDLESYEEYVYEDDFEMPEIPDMSDWTDEEIESWYNELWGEDVEENEEEVEHEVPENNGASDEE